MFHKLVVASSLFSFLLLCSGVLAEDAIAAPSATSAPVEKPGATKAAVKPKKAIKRTIYQIVFSSNRDAPLTEQSIYAMNFDGSNVRRLTDPQSDQFPGLDDRCPAVSPDGSQVAFARYVDDQYKYDLFVLDTKTSKISRITHDVGTESHPTWSPDGKNIAFSGRPNRGSGDDGVTNETWSCIHIFNLETGKRWQMTASKNDAYQPAWSFDGDQIAFVGVQNVEDDPLVLGTLRRPNQTEEYGALQGVPRIALTRGTINPVQAIYIASLNSSSTAVKSFRFINESRVARFKRNADGLLPSDGAFDGKGYYIRKVQGSFSSPAWSLDNSTLFYLTSKDDNLGNTHLYAQNLQTGDIGRLIPNSLGEGNAVMVSNGTSPKFVYVQPNRGNSDIAVGDLGRVPFNMEQLTGSPFLGGGRHLVSMEPSCYLLISKVVVRQETAPQ